MTKSSYVQVTLSAILGIALIACGGGGTTTKDAGAKDTKAAGGAKTGGSTATGGSTSTGGAKTGGATSTGGVTSTGGSATGGSATGGSATGGSATGGSATGGVVSTGGSATGGSVSDGSVATGGTIADAGAPDVIDAPVDQPDSGFPGEDASVILADAEGDSGDAQDDVLTVVTPEVGPDTQVIVDTQPVDVEPDTTPATPDTAIATDTAATDAVTANCVQQIKTNGYLATGADPCSACSLGGTDRSAECVAFIDCLATETATPSAGCASQGALLCCNNQGSNSQAAACVNALLTAASCTIQ